MMDQSEIPINIMKSMTWAMHMREGGVELSKSVSMAGSQWGFSKHASPPVLNLRGSFMTIGRSTPCLAR